MKRLLAQSLRRLNGVVDAAAGVRLPIAWFYWGWLPLFLLAVAVALSLRPLMPVDETRYLAVAWDMWHHGHWLVPHLNGEPYSHKPPLLFWLIQLGWAVFGVNAFTPRLIAPLFALGSLLLARVIARKAWPRQPEVARLVPWLLVGAVYWLGFSTMVMFDMLVVFFVLLGIYGIQCLAAGDRRGWWWLFLGVGLGVLAKGPFALIFLVPATVLAPWWAGVPLCWSWFLRSGLVGIAASSLGLVWALIAAWSGGSEYAHEVLWGQMADRTVASFDHGEPVYYYLLVALPLMTLPWLLLPDFWPAALRRLTRLGLDSDHGQPFAINPEQWWLLTAWVLLPLLFLSLVSGKLPHYVLPMLPGLALFAAVRLVRVVGTADLDTRPLMLMWWLFALTFVFASWLGKSRLLQDLPWWTSLLALLLGLCAWLLWPRRPLRDQIPLVSLQTLVVLVLLHIGFTAIRPAFDFRDYAQAVQRLEQAGHPLAFMGKYRGEYDFYGRLDKPIKVVFGKPAVTDFCRAHEGGVLLMRTKNRAFLGPALFSTRFRSGYDVALNCGEAVMLLQNQSP